MSIIIFGGSGFIGSKLCSRLKKSCEIFQIVDKLPSVLFPEKVLRADIRKPISLTFSCTPAVFFNLAAEHRDDVMPLSLYEEVNINGAINVCNLARTMNVNKIIFTSSVAVYGFAPRGTNEYGAIAPFNEYGRTKHKAEEIYKKWQDEDPHLRSLVIIRPTVVFGEGNRGNFFNLLRQIASGKFVMVGDGLNKKSMAYVENIAAFLEHSLNLKPGVHTYNYTDKPDLDMNALVALVNKLLGKSTYIKFRLPLRIAYLIGCGFDLIAFFTRIKFSISAIRIKKFCANSIYDTATDLNGFTPPVPLIQAIEKTVHYEFIDAQNTK